MAKTIINRLKEPSSWAALSALGVLFGAPPDAVNAAVQIGAGLAALVAFVLPESKA